MSKKSFIILIILLSFTFPAVYGYTELKQPATIDNPLNFIINDKLSPTFVPSIDEETICAPEFITRNEQCGGTIKVFEQCLSNNLGQLEWVEKKQNCGDYDGMECINGLCAKVPVLNKVEINNDNDSYNMHPFILISIVAVLLALFVILIKKTWGRIFLIVLIMGIMPQLNGAYFGSDAYSRKIYMEEEISDLNSCYNEKNVMLGECNYLYLCYRVYRENDGPMSELMEAKCVDITADGKGTIDILNFVPERGDIYISDGVVVKVNYEWSSLKSTWLFTSELIEIPVEKEAVNLCRNNTIYKNDMCYKYKEFCLDSSGVNYCSHDYRIYELEGVDKLVDNKHLCADGQDGNNMDMICDIKTEIGCMDINSNGVCDYIENQAEEKGCYDLNGNRICDYIEVDEDCPLMFDPVCVIDGDKELTFPNSCFSKAVGYTESYWHKGTCEQLPLQCVDNDECPSPCAGVNPICNNGYCEVDGMCLSNEYVCKEDNDCPESSCTGVISKCTENNQCEYEGRCVALKEDYKPEIGVFEKVKNNIRLFWYKVKGVFNGKD